MNIDLKKKNKELSIITLEISSQDYKDKVESILNDYKKKANIPRIDPTEFKRTGMASTLLELTFTFFINQHDYFF